MKTLKKILVMCMTLVVMVGVTGCVDSDKQERLIQFINVDLSEAKELETEANELYTNNVGDNYESDEALYNALKDTIVPNYEKMVKDVSAIDLGEYTEFNELKSLIIQYWSKKLEAFNKMIDALEAQDSDRVTKNALPLKDEILSIIDKNENDYDVKEGCIKALDGGKVYATLLQDCYPALRHSDYTVRYVVRGFNVEEAKQIIRTRPQQLSLLKYFYITESGNIFLTFESVTF